MVGLADDLSLSRFVPEAKPAEDARVASLCQGDGYDGDLGCSLKAESEEPQHCAYLAATIDRAKRHCIPLAEGLWRAFACISASCELLAELPTPEQYTVVCRNCRRGSTNIVVIFPFAGTASAYSDHQSSTSSSVDSA